MLNHSDALLFRLFKKFQECMSRGIGSHPELARLEVGEHSAHATHVVGMPMREYNGVETRDATCPEIR